MESLEELAEQRKRIYRQIAELEGKVKSIKDQQRNKIVLSLKEIIREYEICVFEIYDVKNDNVPKPDPKSKYRDDNGNAWNGFGAIPNWLRGKHLREYLIKHE